MRVVFFVPQMRFYIVRRDTLTIVRSVADRLRLTANATCGNNLTWAPAGWGPLLTTKSNDTCCLIRIAASVIDYYHQVKVFTRDFNVDVAEIHYEEYVKGNVKICKLCTKCQTGREGSAKKLMLFTATL